MHRGLDHRFNRKKSAFPFELTNQPETSFHTMANSMLRISTPLLPTASPLLASSPSATFRGVSWLNFEILFLPLSLPSLFSILDFSFHLLPDIREVRITTSLALYRRCR